MTRPKRMTWLTNSRHWTLHGLVHCGFCEQPMYAAQRPGGPRTYKFGLPCERSNADANELELMAYCTTVAALSSQTRATGRDAQTALYAELYRRVVVHGDVSDVRFIGQAT